MLRNKGLRKRRTNCGIHINYNPIKWGGHHTSHIHNFTMHLAKVSIPPVFLAIILKKTELIKNLFFLRSHKSHSYTEFK